MHGGLVANVPIGTIPQPPPPSNIIHNCVSIDEMDPSKETIFFEYIPRILYTKQVLNGSKVDIGSDSGVIMIIMLNGDVFFYPSNVSLLDQLPDIFLNSPNSSSNNSNNTSTSNNKSNKQNKNNLKSKYNIPLNLSPDHKVFSFDFRQVDPSENFIYNTDNSSTTSSANNSDNEEEFDNSSNNNNNQHNNNNNNEGEANQFIDFIPVRYRRPRKIIVSNDKKLLMIIGNFVKGVSCLTIYKILEEGPHYFQLLFYDSSFTYVDACFSSDSTTMASILARYPNFIFVLQIPGLISQSAVVPSSGNNNSSNNNSSKNNSNDKSPNNNNTNIYKHSFVETIEYQEKRISFETRIVGPIAIVGPVQNCLGEPYHMTHIASNPNLKNEKLKPFEFITWNDDSLGEFCFWNIYKSKLKTKPNVQSQPQPTTAQSSQSSQTSQTSQTSQSSQTTQPAAAAATQPQQSQPQQNYNSPLKNIPQLKFEWMTKFINPVIVEKNQIDKEKIPKSFIINMEFSPNGDLVMAIVRRENHDQKNKLLNGIGIQCIPTTLDLLNYGSPFYPDGTAFINPNNNISSTNYQNHYKNNINNNNNTPQNKSNSDDNDNNNINTIGGNVSSQWFQISESNDKSIIIASKWSDSLFFGGETQYLPAVLVKEKGIFELISNNHCAQFTNSSEEFMKTCVNFIQMGKYHRLWISTYGILYSITMTPKNDKYIDWIPTVCDQTNNNNSNYAKYQKVSQMIGYNLLNNLSSSSPSLVSSSSSSSPSSLSPSLSSLSKEISNKKKSDESKHQKQQQQQSSNSNNNNNSNNDNDNTQTKTAVREHSGNGEAEVYSCLHLYKCWSCKLTLIKPLICGFCKSVAYCSRECQKEHWLNHREQCIIPSLPIINNHVQLQQLQYQHQQQTLQRLNYQQNNKL